MAGWLAHYSTAKQSRKEKEKKRKEKKREEKACWIWMVRPPGSGSAVLGSVWFGDGLGPSLISGLGQTQFHVWLLGWVGPSFLFGCKNKVGWSDSISCLDGGMRVDQGIWSPSW